MKTGEREIALLFHRCAELNLPIVRGSALDFGCGVGRLTQALGRRFDAVSGVDISSGMVAVASRVNAYAHVKYVRSLRALQFASFDFLYSNIVLQHMPPEMSEVCIADLVRLMSPDGVLVFQLPSRRVDARTATTRPMPNAAYRAALRVVQGSSEAMAGQRMLWTVEVTNASEEEWRQPDVGSIRLGNHWFDVSGDLMIVQDDGRATLPQVVKPGAPRELTLEMTAPSSPGGYVLEIDVVHEGISWFAHKGSIALRVPLEVRPDDGARERAAAAIVEYAVPAYDAALVLPSDRGAPSARRDEVDFPMYGVERDRVVELIREHGGRVVQIDDDPRTGGDWESYRYFVTRQRAL
jgi:SAM-dependent methyltransferase